MAVKRILPVDGEWIAYTTADLDMLRATGKPKQAALLEKAWDDYNKNRLAHFLPHGLPWSEKERVYGEGVVVLAPSEYDPKFQNDGVAFLSDWEHDHQLFIAPRKTGKTTAGVAKDGIFTCQCDPRWPIFRKHGVEYREWQGPKKLYIASYEWHTLRMLWDLVRQFFPRYELGPFADEWGKYPGEKGRPKFINFNNYMQKEIQLLRSKSILMFGCYKQSQASAETFESDAAHWDEQPPRTFHVAWSDGTRARGDYTPDWFTMSGYRIKDRPDTGAAGFVFQDLYRRNRLGTASIVRYHNDIPSTPDVFVSARKKKTEYDKYENPETPRDRLTTMRAVGSYWPGFETSGGKVISAFDRNMHLIPRIWNDNEIPDRLCKYRVLDYGTSAGTNCCAWFAMTWPGFAHDGVTFADPIAICYRLLYKSDFEIADTAQAVIEMSHNRRREVGSWRDEKVHATFTCWDEEQVAESYCRSILDGRSATQKQMGASVANIFARYGLALEPARGLHFEASLPELSSWLTVDPNRPHLTRRNDDGSPEMGAPRLYIIDDQAEPVLEEFDSWFQDPETNKTIKPKRDHAISTFLYFCTAEPTYVEPIRWGRETLRGDPRTLTALARHNMR